MVEDTQWKPVRLGDIVTVKHGWAFKSECMFEELTGKPILVNIGNFSYTGGFRFESTRTREYRGEYPEEYELKPGDILLAMTCQTSGGEILGIPARVPNDGRVYLHNQRLGKVVIHNHEKVIPDFLYWLFLWKNFNTHLCATATGTKILHTSPNRIEDYKFLLPPINEQEGIASTLYALENKNKLNISMNALLEAIGKTVFKRWFVDFEFPNQEGKPYKTTGGKMQYNEELAKDIPTGWKSGTINDLCESITSGGTPKRMENQYWNGEIPWFKTGELTDDPLIDSEEHITQEGLENSACKLWVENTILIALYASPTVGRLGLLKTNAASNQACSGLVAKKEIGYPFVFYTLLFKRSEFNNIAVGAAQQNINQQIVKETKTLIPPKELLSSFNNLVNLFFDKRTLLLRQNRTLSQIRDSLLPKLMSGKIRVPINGENVEAPLCQK